MPHARTLLLAAMLALAAAARGQQVVEGIIVRGNDKTQSWLVLREVTARAGDTLGPAHTARLERSAENLRNTSLFNSVRVYDTAIYGRQLVIIDVEERWYLWPFPVMASSGSNVAAVLHERAWERFSYGVMLMKYNCRGRGETLTLRGRLGYRRQLGFLYDAPTLGPRRQNTGWYVDLARFGQRSFPYAVQDERFVYAHLADIGFVETTLKGGLRYRPATDLVFFVQLSASHLDGHAPLAARHPGWIGSPSGRAWWAMADYGVEHSTQDYERYPTRGERLTATFTQGAGPGGAFFAGMLADLRAVIPAGPRLRYSAAALAECYLGAKPPIGLRRTTGENYYLRGYEDYLWDSRGMALARNQLSYNILRKRTLHVKEVSSRKFNRPSFEAHLTLFADAGVPLDPGGAPRAPLAAVGCGVDIVAYYDMVLRLEAAANLAGEHSLSLHVGSVF